MTELGIIADDLTGAMDTGVQLAKRGLRTVVMLGEGELPSADAVVVSTDSRDVAAEEAYRRARQAAERLRGCTLYKKIDSTLRGNIGPELDGILDSLGLEQALVAPSFPSAGRTVVDGYHRVNGVLLAESAFVRDPLWPARESHVPTILARQTRRNVGHLPLPVVERGVEAVVDALKAETASIVAADAVGAVHLRTLARALARLGDAWLPCGSAGLAEEWPLALGMGQAAAVPFCWPPNGRPVLVLAGSRNPATARQLERGAASGELTLIRLSLEGDWREAVEGALALLKDGRNAAVTTTFSDYREGKTMAAADILARVAEKILARSTVAGLFVTGGDVARAVCRALGVRALCLLGEMQAGVPAGTFVGGAYEGLRVVTKAGGFGDDKTILESVHCIHGR